MAHEPQIPSRHERRKVRVGSISFLILMRASRIYSGVRGSASWPKKFPHHRTSLIQVNLVRLKGRLCCRFIWVLQHCQEKSRWKKPKYPAVDLEFFFQDRFLCGDSLKPASRGAERTPGLSGQGGIHDNGGQTKYLVDGQLSCRVITEPEAVLT